jgi:hypothetical protein
MSQEQQVKSTGCCELIDPNLWEDKTVIWQNKSFVADHVTSFLHIPLNMGAKMVKNMKLIKASQAEPALGLMLCDEGSLWGNEIFIDATKDVLGAKMAKLSGTFMTKVFEGSYKDAGKWAQEMAAFVKAKGKEMKKLYFFYTTCPKCAKAYGKNYVVLFAKID